MSEKVYSKKLTNVGGGVCALALIALIVSAAGAASEFIFTAAYNQFYENHIDYFFAEDVTGYFANYSAVIAITVFSLIMTVWSFSAKRVKRAGREFGLTAIFISLGIAAPSGVILTSELTRSSTYEIFSHGSDGSIFRLTARLIVYGVPVLAGLFLIIAGIAALARLGRGNTVEVSAAVNDGGTAGLPISPIQSVLPGQMAETGRNDPAVTEVRADIADDRPLKLCPSCGEPVEQGEKFCANCGGRIGG